MRLRQRLITCAVASLATLPCAVTALAQSAPQPPPTAQNHADDQRNDAQRRQLEAEQRNLEQHKERIEQQLRRAQEQVRRAAQQAEQAGRRAAEQAERAARRAAEQGQQLARRAQEEAQRQYRAFRPYPAARNAPQPGQPPHGDFERELFKAQGLDTGGAPGDAGAPFLGVSTMPAPDSLRQRVELPPGIGLVVQSVEPGSPAEQAGVKQYDILHKLNDQLLVNMEQLSVLVRTFKPGEEVRLTVVRGGRAQELTARLGERRAERRGPQQPGQPNQPGPFGQPPRGGGGGFGGGFGNKFGGVAPWPQNPQPREFWMPNPLLRGQPSQIQPPQPGQPSQPWQPNQPGPSPRRASRAAPAQPTAPLLAPVPTAPAAPPQLHVVPVPRAEPVPVIVATPVPAPQPYALPVPAPEPVQP